MLHNLSHTEPITPHPVAIVFRVVDFWPIVKRLAPSHRQVVVWIVSVARSRDDDHECDIGRPLVVRCAIDLDVVGGGGFHFAA